ncbi:unnamed protein product [Peronospora farinosa]|uniref:B30.2/SPRY domain-containing protein n=1 Tax=Peronospora farinosa TaxID=134698 RepID=A0AAV0TQD1_9STRA|nr:unnamed protein product [Peronospora farinosa]CAI5724181.1 unnamed protein product [Peronospora farinosa]
MQVLRHFYFTSGHHYWEVLVERMLDPRGVVVGVAPSEAVETGVTEEAVGYAATGVILHSGVEVCRAQAFAVGDTVGVYLDMNRHEVAFFLNDEAQLDPRETDEVTVDEGETAHGRVVGAGLEEGMLEMKAPAYAANTRRVSWYSFRSRTVFAAIALSSEADNLVIVRSDVPVGYR